MKADPNQLHFATLAELMERLKLAPPQHPLMALINYDQVKPDLAHAEKRFVLEFYKISFKPTFNGFVHYGPGTYDFKDGGLAFLGPNQPVEMSADLEQYQGYVLYFHPDLLLGFPFARMQDYGFFSYTVNEALFLSAREKQVIVNAFEVIDVELSNRADHWTQGLLVTQLLSLLQLSNRFYDRQFITRKVVHHDLIDGVQEYLSHYLANAKSGNAGLPTSQEIAAHLHVSPRYLSDMLKALTGKTTQEHIHLRLMERAKEILLTTKFTTAQVAYQLGFEHPQSFNKFFKLKTGTTPLSFRRSAVT